MKKLAVLFILLCIVLAGCKENTQEDTEEIKEEEIKETDEIQLLIDSMSLEEKVGQLFIIRPDALTTSISLEEVDNVNADGIKKVTDEMRYLYTCYPVGGFALFNKNLKDEEQLIRLTSDLKEMGAGRTEPLICIDEEGGRVARIANNGAFGVEVFEEMEDITDADRARYLGKTIGDYLEKYGIDQDFAPVADVNTNPNNKVIGNRAFGSDPSIAKEMVRSVIEGMHESSTLTCIKHFPGHGDTSTDTHTGYAETLKSWDELLNCEMIPFIEGIKAGTDMVMIAHIAAPNITGTDEPATVSYEIITEKLRNELGYDGVVITDSCAMGAITKYYTSAEVSVKAIQAGVDIILMPEDYFSAFEGVKAAVLNGTISYERLNESVYRILKLKSER